MGHSDTVVALEEEGFSFSSLETFVNIVIKESETTFEVVFKAN